MLLESNSHDCLMQIPLFPFSAFHSRFEAAVSLFTLNYYLTTKELTFRSSLGTGGYAVTKYFLPNAELTGVT